MKKSYGTDIWGLKNNSNAKPQKGGLIADLIMKLKL